MIKGVITNEEPLKKRTRILRLLEQHGEKRKKHNAENRRLTREFHKLALEARRCEPPISTYEIGRLTRTSQQTASRITSATETPNQGANANV